MRFLFSVLASAMLAALVGIDCAAQEVQLRQEAETLLERADSISTPRQFHSYDQTIVFRSFSATGLQQGRFTSVVQGPRSYRDEYELATTGCL